MKLSTRVRYGLRAALDIAEHAGNGPVKMKAIAQRQEISAKYLEHLLAVLKARGLVRVTRGARGGYELARPPAEIRVGEIFRSLEGPLHLVECAENPFSRRRYNRCVTREVWTQMKCAVEQVVDGMTLADLLARQQAKQATTDARSIGVSYSI